MLIRSPNAFFPFRWVRFRYFFPPVQGALDSSSKHAAFFRCLPWKRNIYKSPSKQSGGPTALFARFLTKKMPRRNIRKTGMADICHRPAAAATKSPASKQRKMEINNSTIVSLTTTSGGCAREQNVPKRNENKFGEFFRLKKVASSLKIISLCLCAPMLGEGKRNIKNVPKFIRSENFLLHHQSDGTGKLLSLSLHFSFFPKKVKLEDQTKN